MQWSGGNVLLVICALLHCAGIPFEPILPPGDKQVSAPCVPTTSSLYLPAPKACPELGYVPPHTLQTALRTTSHIQQSCF